MAAGAGAARFAAAISVVIAGCANTATSNNAASTASPDNATTAVVSSPETTPPPPIPPSAASEGATGGGLFAVPATLSGSSTSALLVVSGGLIPPDLRRVRPSAPTLEAEREEAPVSDRDVALGWEVAMLTARYDDAATLRGESLGALAASADVAATAATVLAPSDPTGFEARWPTVTAMSGPVDGWFEAAVAINTTRAGQVGPSSAGVTLRVHVTAGGVDAWTMR